MEASVIDEEDTASKALLTALLNASDRPVVIPDAVSKFVMENMSLVPILNNQIHNALKPKTPAEFQNIYNIIYRFINTHTIALSNNLDNLLDLISMEDEHPWFPLMPMFILLGLLTAVADGIPLLSELDRMARPNKIKTFTNIVQAGMASVCYKSPEKRIDQLTCRELDQCIWMLTAKAVRLRITEDVRSYTLALIHRALILISSPFPETVCDDVAGREICDPAAGLYRVKTDCLRVWSGSLLKMLGEFNFYLDHPKQTCNCPDPSLYSKVSNKLHGKIAEFCNSETIYMENRKDFDEAFIFHTERERFTTMRNMEMCRPSDLRIYTKTNSAKISFQRLIDRTNFVYVLSQAREGTPRYFTHQISIGEHVVTTNLLLKAVEMTLYTGNNPNFNFRPSFVVKEAIFHRSRKAVEMDPYPLIVILFKRTFLLFKGTLYECGSLVDVIIAWATVMRDEFSGNYNRTVLTQGLNELLCEGEIQEEADAWGGNPFV